MKIIIHFLILSMLAAVLAAQPVLAGEVVQANLGREGQTINPKSLIVPGRQVVVDFFSPYCPPCLKLAPRLEQLAAKTNLIVMKVNINRPGIQGIDWQSPVAQQYGLKAVPYLVLLNPKGKMIAEGQQAMEIIGRQMQKVGIADQESPADRAFKMSAPKAARAPAPASEAETGPPTIATVRKAKKAQGLKGVIFQDRNSGKWFLEDRDGDNYKFEGGQWVKIGGQEPPMKADDRVQAPEPAPAPTREAESSPPTIATVRKAKKAQGLKGFIFQDRNSGKWFLEDREGDNYKFEGGRWVKIAGQEQPVSGSDRVQAPEPTPAPVKQAETGPPTIATVRKAKKAQGLKGYIFQDRNSGKWFLEDRDGDNYKFEGGQWVKLN